MKRWHTGVYLASSGNRIERRWREVKVIWSCLAKMEAGEWKPWSDLGEMERWNESTRERHNKRCSGDRKGTLQAEKLHLGKERQTTGVWRGKQQ